MTSRLSASALRASERRAHYKLAVVCHVEEVISGNVAASCRDYGVSQQAYYEWLKRYETEGFEGLMDRSSAPTICHYDRGRSGQEDPLAASAVPLRSGEDHEVSEAISRQHDQRVRCLADPEEGRTEPPPLVTAIQAHTDPLEEIPKAAARPRAAG